MTGLGKRWVAPPSWPQPPVGWSPPPGWQPDPSWGPPPQDWIYWQDEPGQAHAVKEDLGAGRPLDPDSGRVHWGRKVAKQVDNLRAPLQARLDPEEKLVAVFSISQIRPMADLLVLTTSRVIQAEKSTLFKGTDFARTVSVELIASVQFTWAGTIELTLSDGSAQKLGTLDQSDRQALESTITGLTSATTSQHRGEPGRHAANETTPSEPRPAPRATPVAAPSPQTDPGQSREVPGPTPSIAAAHDPPQVEEKITAFNARKVAQRLQEENRGLTDELNRLRTHLANTGALDGAEREARVNVLKSNEAGLLLTVEQLRRQKAELDAGLIVSRDRLALEDLGIFDFEHPAENSASLATELESLRSEIRQTNKIGQAITAASGFTFNNSAAKGQTFVNQMSRIMLRAYNAEAENAIKTVKAGNLVSAQKRLSTAREQIAKQGTMIELSVTERYHYQRLRELEFAARHLQALAAEKELERERRAELREQKLLEAEIKKAKERLEKERAHYLNSIQRLRASGDEAAATALQSELDRIDAEIAEADYRAANIRAGYVYVISNIGAFGEGLVKIGMTRRLDPMDRVKELGDASVPFTFDVHALFFSDDAVGVEAMLHRQFAPERLNKVNCRKEFFRVHPQAVLDALRQHKISVLEFNTHAAAEDFRASWPDQPSEGDRGATPTDT